MKYTFSTKQNINDQSATFEMPKIAFFNSNKYSSQDLDTSYSVFLYKLVKEH